MVRSETDNEKGTLLPKPIRKLWTMGTVPSTDEGFVNWVAQQPKSVTKHGTSYCMNLYVQNLNFEDKITYERQLKEYNDKLQSMEGTEPTPSVEPIEEIAVESNDAQNMNIPTSLHFLSQPLEHTRTPIPRTVDPHASTSFPEQSKLTPSILSATKCPED